MIHFNFSLRNPFSRLHNSKVLLTRLVTNHKCLEIEYVRDADIFGLWFNWTLRQSHAGISIGLSLLSFGFYATLEDIRHWDYNNKTWEKYDDEQGC